MYRSDMWREGDSKVSSLDHWADCGATTEVSETSGEAGFLEVQSRVNSGHR